MEKKSKESDKNNQIKEEDQQDSQSPSKTSSKSNDEDKQDASGNEISKLNDQSSSNNSQVSSMISVSPTNPQGFPFPSIPVSLPTLLSNNNGQTNQETDEPTKKNSNKKEEENNQDSKQTQLKPTQSSSQSNTPNININPSISSSILSNLITNNNGVSLSQEQIQQLLQNSYLDPQIQEQVRLSTLNNEKRNSTTGGTFTLLNSQEQIINNSNIASLSGTGSSNTEGNSTTKRRYMNLPRKSVKNCRDDNSLRLLTKRFVALIAESNDGTLDLNTAATTLEVQKRRIYDITNVLEGIGLIEKKSKNNIKWKGSGIAVTPVDDCEEIRQIKSELGVLEDEEKRIDENLNKIKQIMNDISQHPEYQRKAYVTYNDIRNIENLKDRTIIAIRAPPGTTLQVPDPDHGMSYPERRYQIYLQSPNEQIKVYLLNDEQARERTEESTNVDPDSSYLDDSMNRSHNDSMDVSTDQIDSRQSLTNQQINQYSNELLQDTLDQVLEMNKSTSKNNDGNNMNIESSSNLHDNNENDLRFDLEEDPDFMYGMETGESLLEFF